MANTAQGHKSSVGPSRGEDEARNSDSGDSVFFTQKPLPEAVRSGGRRLPRRRSACTQEGPPERVDDLFSSSSSSEEESRTKRRRRRRRALKAPSCRFSFLSERKGQTDGLLRVKIKKLHSYMIGGYMKHVQELWESYERGEDVAASLPTVDVDEEISPVSEEEKDEAIEDEDIKVVERKHFATSIKAKSSKPWCASNARSGRKRNPSPALNGSPGQQQKTLPKVSMSEPMLKETPSAAMQTCHDEDALCGDLKETESQVTSGGKTGDPYTEVVHLDEQSHFGNSEHENGNLSQSEVNNTLCLKKRRKNKEDKDVCEGVEKEKKQDETEGQHEEELLSPLEDINMKDVQESKPKKKKKPASEDGRQDDGSEEEASVVSSITQADWKTQKKDADVDVGRTDPAADLPIDEANVRRTKNNKKKDPNVTSDLSERPTEHHVETPGSLLGEPNFTKRKDKKKKHSASAGEDGNFCNDAVTNTELRSQTKMVDISDAAENDENIDNTQKEERDPELKAKKNNISASAGEDANFSNDITNTDSTSQQRKKTNMVYTSDTVEEDETVVNKQKEEQAPELKTKKKKKKPASEDGRQDSRSVEEASVVSSKTQADWKTQKKDADVDVGRTEPAAQPPTDEANIRRTKNNKKKDPNVTSDLSERPTEHHVENTEVPQETPGSLLREPNFTKRKDKKKKHSASAGEDGNFCNDAVTNTELRSQTKMVDISDAAENDENIDNTQKEERDPELKAKKNNISASAGEDANFSNDITNTDSTSQQRKKTNMVYTSDTVKEDETVVNKQKEEQAPELKTKKKKKKPASEDGRQDSRSVEEASVVSSITQADWKTQKKDADVDVGRTEPAAQPPTDEANIRRTKNNKKKDPNVTSDLSERPTEHHVENTEAPQETPGSLLREPNFTKRKDKKKKHSASAGEDGNLCNDAVTNTDSTSQTKMVDISDTAMEDKQKEEQAPELKAKKKKKFASAGKDATFCNDNATKADLTSQQKKKKKMVDISDAAEEDEKGVNKQEEEKAPELKTKKKKRKNNWSVAACEDTVAPVNYTALVREKKKKEMSSFLVARDKENGGKERQKPLLSAAEKLDVSTTDLAANSAENEGSSERLKDKAKKKKRKNNWSVAACGDTVAPVNYTALVWEKEKKAKSSFLVPYNKENGGKERQKPLLSAAEKPDVSAADLAANSAENEGNSERLKDKAKKKKRKNNWSVAACGDTVAPVNYTALVQEKEKKAASSFLAADEEENGAEERHESSQSAAETLNVSDADLVTNSAEKDESWERLKDGTKTKKKKRSTAQDSVEGATRFKEPEGTPAIEVKKKRKCERRNGELTSPTDISLEESQTDADVPLKKKKKKKIPPAASEDAESEASTQFSSDSQKKTLKKKIEKAENKLSPAKKWFPEPAESEARKTKQTERTDFNLASKAPCLSLKPKNKKRKLYDASRDFFSDL